jgi:WD40 repeat protein
VRCAHLHTFDIRSEEERQERKRVPTSICFDKHHQGRNVLLYSDVIRSRIVFYDFGKQAAVRNVSLRPTGTDIAFAPSSFDISPQCDYIAVGTFSSRILIADYSGERGVMQSFDAHCDIVTRVAFDATGQRLFSASKNSEVCMWNAYHALSDSVLA